MRLPCSVISGPDTLRAGMCINGSSTQIMAGFSPRKSRSTTRPFDASKVSVSMVRDSDGVLTTSFLRRVDEVKDNRLRPKGFDPAMFANSPSPFIQALAELHGEARFDDHYFDPSLTGSDEIEYLARLDEGDLDRAASVVPRDLPRVRRGGHRGADRAARLALRVAR